MTYLKTGSWGWELLAILAFHLAVGVTAQPALAEGPTLEGRTCSARVSEVYPTAAELPENLLRFYIYFSQPMERQGILSFVEIVDDQGQSIPGIFLENRYELWSPDSRRLTLILDPGRVKTGLASHDLLGRALQAGTRYTLRVRPGAPDAEGCRLAVEHRKPFTAAAEDRTAPDVHRWQLDVPERGSRQPLTVALDGPHDHLSLAYRLRVLDASGEIVAGSIELDGGETLWRFTPTGPWSTERYRLTVDPLLEDLAGNRPGRVFDQGRGEGQTMRPLGDPIVLPFTPD